MRVLALLMALLPTSVWGNVDDDREVCWEVALVAQEFCWEHVCAEDGPGAWMPQELCRKNCRLNALDQLQNCVRQYPICEERNQ